MSKYEIHASAEMQKELKVYIKIVISACSQHHGPVPNQETVKSKPIFL